MTTIRVINHLERPFKGRYDGKDYKFLPGVPVDLSVEAAAHIFDLAKEDKSQALNMLGVLRPGDSYEEALKVLDGFSFQEGKTVFDDELAPRRGRKGSGRSSPQAATGPGGNTGGEPARSPPGDHDEDDPELEDAEA
jgi:hypothetical protein